MENQTLPDLDWINDAPPSAGPDDPACPLELKDKRFYGSDMFKVCKKYHDEHPEILKQATMQGIALLAVTGACCPFMLLGEGFLEVAATAADVNGLTEDQFYAGIRKMTWVLYNKMEAIRPPDVTLQ